MKKRGQWGVAIALFLIVTMTALAYSTGSIEKSDFLVENTYNK
jgi:hypothetical protein